MKSIVGYIFERLKLTSKSNISKDNILQGYVANGDFYRDLQKADIKYLKTNDEWSKKCFKALKDKFSNKYDVDINWNGAIWIYKKGRTSDTKDLICMIYSNAYIRFRDEDFVESLGQDIFDIMDEIN